MMRKEMIKRKREIEQELDCLYKEFETASNMDNEAVCETFGADSKQEYLELLTEEIDRYEAMYEQFLEEYNLPDDDGMDYDELCRIQGLSRFA